MNDNLIARCNVAVAGQLLKHIPTHLVPKLARETGVEDKARTYTPWSHVVTMGYAQVAHSLSLNDVCDDLALNSGPLSAIRGATPPKRNTLSYANRERDAAMAERLFWETLEALGKQSPGFGQGKLKRKYVKRLKRAIHAVDSTTIQLVAQCIPWAQHRRRKAAAKCHTRLDLQSRLPQCVIVDTAREADAKRARELCADLQEGEITLFDKAYVDFSHLGQLTARGVIWVTRAKENLQSVAMESYAVKEGGRVVKDELIGLTHAHSQEGHPELMRRVEAWVEVDGQERLMVFLTNQLTWSPETIVELYGCRWAIEVFFKELKQTLQLADFLGTSANAVRWQIWTALLVNLLMRYMAFLSQWPHSFSRLFTLIRAALWTKLDLLSLLRAYGTAGGRLKMVAQPAQAYLPGFA